MHVFILREIIGQWQGLRDQRLHARHVSVSALASLTCELLLFLLRRAHRPRPAGRRPRGGGPFPPVPRAAGALPSRRAAGCGPRLSAPGRPAQEVALGGFTLAFRIRHVCTFVTGSLGP